MRVLDVYGRAPGGLLANGLAFAALFAAFPIVLVVLGVAGLVVDDPDAQDRLAEALKSSFPPLADFVDQALAALKAGATAASLLGFIGVVWAVSQFYVTLDVAFSSDLRGHRPSATPCGGPSAASCGSPSSSRSSSRSSCSGSSRPPWGRCSRTIAVSVSASGRSSARGRSCWRWASGSSSWLPDAAAGDAVGPGDLAAGGRSSGIAIVVLSQLFLMLAPLLVGAAALAGSLATAFIALAWLSFTFQALLYGAAWVRVRG